MAHSQTPLQTHIFIQSHIRSVQKIPQQSICKAFYRITGLSWKRFGPSGSRSHETGFLGKFALTRRGFDNKSGHRKAPSNVAEVLSVYIRLTAFTEDSRAYLLVSYHIAFPQSSYRGNLSPLSSKPVLVYGSKRHFVESCCLILLYGDVTRLNVIDSLRILST